MTWDKPEVWTDSASVFMTKGHSLILAPKEYIQVKGMGAHRSEVGVARRAWDKHVTESKAGGKLWAAVQPLQIKEWAPLRSWALYTDMPAWEVEEVEVACSACGMWADQGRVHRMCDCWVLRVNVLWWVEQVVELLVELEVAIGRVHRRWGVCVGSGINQPGDCLDTARHGCGRHGHAV